MSYLTYPVVEEAIPKGEGESGNANQDSFLTADKLCERWGIGPAQLVGLIQGNNADEFPVYWRDRYADVPF